MQLRCKTLIPFPRPVVFSTYRDELPTLLDYLPNVRSIEVKERREKGSLVHIVNVWMGGGDIPSVARAFVSEAMLSWTDVATWHNDTFTTHWEVRPHAFAEAVTGRGTNRYTELEQGTQLEVVGELSVDATKIRGVPRMLASKVSHAVEDHLVKLVAKNLLDVSRGVTRYLRDRGRDGTS